MNKTEYEQLKKINGLVEATAKITKTKTAYGFTMQEIKDWRKDIDKDYQKAERKREKERKKMEKELRYREKYPDWEFKELKYFRDNFSEIWDMLEKNPDLADDKANIYPFYRDA